MAPRVTWKRTRWSTASDKCYACARNSSADIGAICLTYRDVENLKFCKLHQVLKARKPLCCECRLRLHRCAFSLRTSYGLAYFDTVNEKEDAYCAICGSCSHLRFLLTAQNSSMSLLIRRITKKKVQSQFAAATIVCYLCKQLVDDLLVFYKLEKKELEDRKLKAKQRRKFLTWK